VRHQINSPVRDKPVPVRHLKDTVRSKNKTPEVEESDPGSDSENTDLLLQAIEPVEEEEEGMHEEFNTII